MLLHRLARRACAPSSPTSFSSSSATTGSGGCASPASGRPPVIPRRTRHGAPRTEPTAPKRADVRRGTMTLLRETPSGRTHADLTGQPLPCGRSRSTATWRRSSASPPRTSRCGPAGSPNGWGEGPTVSIGSAAPSGVDPDRAGPARDPHRRGRRRRRDHRPPPPAGECWLTTSSDWTGECSPGGDPALGVALRHRPRPARHLLGEPRTCPHGHAIPGRTAPTRPDRTRRPASGRGGRSGASPRSSSTSPSNSSARWRPPGAHRVEVTVEPAGAEMRSPWPWAAGSTPSAWRPRRADDLVEVA